MDMNNDFEILNLLNSAFDFLDTSIDEFETKPKYSILHFCVAIELILKSRLLLEHWSLIIDGAPILNNFKERNFKSINYAELVKRINDSTEDNISKETEKIFLQVANERNKIVHFFHPITKEYDVLHDIESAKMDIAVLELNAWEQLKDLLCQWSPIFKDLYDYSGDIENYSYKIKKLECYYDVKYKSIENKIFLDKKRGRLYKNCPNCKKQSSKICSTETKYINEFICDVCKYSFLTFKFVCPSCGEKHYININQFEYKFELTCACQKTYNIKDILEAFFDNIINEDTRGILLDDFVINKDNYFDYKPINCDNCGSYHSGVTRNNIAICVNCGYFQKRSDLKSCDYCGEKVLGATDLSNSNYDGCNFCDGVSDK